MVYYRIVVVRESDDYVVTHGHVDYLENVFALMRSYMKCMKYTPTRSIVSYVQYNQEPTASISKFRCDRQGKITKEHYE